MTNGPTLTAKDASGSQVFTPPANYNLAGDISLTRAGGGSIALPSVRPIGPPHIYGPTAVKGADGLFWVKLEWDDLRGPYMQTGPMEDAMHSSSLTQLVADDWGILRHFFLTKVAGSPDPAGTPQRMVHANVFDTLLIALGEYPAATTDSLFRETSATDPTIITVAGFARPGTNTVITCLRRVAINGAQYCAIGWVNSGGGADTLQLISDLANPPTSTTLAIGTAPTLDVIQVPVYSDALLILNGKSVYRAPAANIAPGAMVFTATETVPGGGYWIGIMGAGVGVGTPSVAGVFPLNGASQVVPGYPTLVAGNTQKGKILLFQLSGQLLGELPVKTKWVTNATKFADGMVYCDQETHYYWDGRNHVPMLRSQDRLSSSNVYRVCAGHYVKGDKFFWIENLTKTPSGTGNTQQYWMEYDLYTNTSRQISFPKDLNTTGPQTVGGANMAVSEQNDFIHAYANGSWYRQYQSPSAVRGFDLRKTSGAASGTGQEYETVGTWISTAVEVTGFESAAKVVARVTGPLNSSLQAGGTGGTPAYLNASITGQAPWTWQQEAKERRLVKEFPLGLNSVFRGPVQLTYESHQQSGGTDDTRYTANLLPTSVEMFMYQKGLEHSSTYRQWDKQGNANG